jgi:hypothetical protein
MTKATPLGDTLDPFCLSSKRDVGDHVCVCVRVCVVDEMIHQLTDYTTKNYDRRHPIFATLENFGKTALDEELEIVL